MTVQVGSMRILKLIILLIAVFGIQGIEAAFEFKGHGASFLANGSCGIAGQDLTCMVFNNPAKLAHYSEDGLELFYRNYFGLKDLNQISLAGRVKIADVPVGLGISRYGNKLYAETEMRIGSALKFGDNVKFGVTINHYHLQIQSYGSASAVGFDFAAIYEISNSLSSAFLISNLNEPTLGQASERLPLLLVIGFSYRPFEGTEISLDTVKEDNFEFDYRFGIQYHFKPWLCILSGFRSSVNMYSIGFALGGIDFKLGYSFLYHPVLGGNNSVSIEYAF